MDSSVVLAPNRFRRLHLGTASPWTLGLGTYAMTFPSVFRDLALSHSPDGSTLKLEHGYAVFIDRSLSAQPNQGWFAGLQIARQTYRLSAPACRSDHVTTLWMPRVGYQWPIGTEGWYVTPWVGVGYTQVNQRQLTAVSDGQGRHPEAKPWLPFATLHVGHVF